MEAHSRAIIEAMSSDLWILIFLVPLFVAQGAAIWEMVSYFRWSPGYYLWMLREADPQAPGALPALPVGVTLEGLRGEGTMIAYRGEGRRLFFHRPGLFGRKSRAIGVLEFDAEGRPTLRWSPFPKVAMWLIAAFFALAAIRGFFFDPSLTCFLGAMAVIFTLVTFYNQRVSKRLVHETMLPELSRTLAAYLAHRARG